VDLPAFHLPGSDVEPHAVLTRDGVRALAPVLTPAQLRAVCDRLVDARAALLRMPTERVVAAIDSAARRLRDPGSARREELLRGLVAFTGYSHAMAALVLDRMSEDWLAPALRLLIDAELGGADAIDHFLTRPDGSRVRAIAPALGLHVFAGNVPGVSVTSIVRALLVRSAVLGKSATGEPLLAPAFARLLADADAEVGACVAVTWWAGGDVPLEEAALARARLVVHYGGADAIASLRARAAADTSFVDHGPRISFALVSAAASRDSAVAHEAARATALFDQQGCVSPQLLYVVGTADDAARFAAALADALAELADALPRGRLEAAEAAAIRELRTRAEFRAIAGENVKVYAGDDLAWSVILDPDPSLSGSCLNRTIVVRHVASLDELIPLVSPFGRFLQTVGVAGFDDRIEEVAARLGDIGASRVTTLAAMPWPPVHWHHDGRGPLRELVRWVDLER
jgi:hypothetical protein